MNILKYYKESMISIYKKQEILYTNIENNNCDNNLITEFLLNYLKLIHKQNLQLEDSSILGYKKIFEKNLEKREKILQDIIHSTNFCKIIQDKNDKIKGYVKDL
jgi:hypothetical protein